MACSRGDGPALRLRHADAAPDQPDAFDIKDYLTIGSWSLPPSTLFDVPKANYRALRRDLPAAPVPAGCSPEAAEGATVDAASLRLRVNVLGWAALVGYASS